MRSALILMAMAGCPWIGPGRLDQVRDPDGDGVVACDFAAPGDPCDCDDDDPNGRVWAYTDADGDGAGAGEATCALGLGGGRVAVGGDCDDGDADVGPPGTPPLFRDVDGDGFGGEPVVTCGSDGRDVTRGGDCDDGDPDVHPDAVEVCDEGQVDEDCDGGADDEDPGGPVEGGVTCFVDADDDGYGDPATGAVACDCEGTPFRALVSGDCDDGDAAVNPASAWYPDLDQDGQGDAHAEPLVLCAPLDPTLLVLDASDCDDRRADVFVGQVDPPWDGLDADCGGGSDLIVPPHAAPSMWSWAADDPLPRAAAGATRSPCGGPLIVVPPLSPPSALQDAIESAPGGAWLEVWPGLAPYEPISVTQNLCIVGMDDDVRIVSAVASVPAVTLQSGGPELILERVVVEGERGIEVTDEGTLVVSRVRFEGTEVAVRSAERIGNLTVLHHVSLVDGGQLAVVPGDVVVRESQVESSLSGSPLLNAGSADVSGLTVTRSAVRVVMQVASGWVERAAVEGLVGGLLLAETVGDERVVLRDVRVDDAYSTEPLVSVVYYYKLGNPNDTVVDLSELRLVHEGPRAAISVDGVNQVALRDSVVVSGAAGPSSGGLVELTASEIEVEGLVSAALPFATALVLDSAAEKTMSHVTLAGGTCVESRGSVLYPPLDSFFVDCGMVGVEGWGGVPPCNAAFDFVTYHPSAPPTQWDLRVHPRSYLKIGAWAPGFDPDLDLIGAVLGAYQDGSPLLEDMADRDGDGVFDSWVAAHVPAASPGDADGDGLLDLDEFGVSFPEISDSDGDGVLDGVDPVPLDPGDSPVCP